MGRAEWPKLIRLQCARSDADIVDEAGKDGCHVVEISSQITVFGPPCSITKGELCCHWALPP